MPISQLGAINTTALIVPDTYIQIVEPQTQLLNGVPTNVLGVVGTASWGPLNAPTLVASMADYAASFGPIKAVKHDAGTAVAAAVLQGANNLRVVRVSDGTHSAAVANIPDGNGTSKFAFVATAVHSGGLGNDIKVTLSAGSLASSYKVSVALPGRLTETFDNIGPAANVAALYTEMIAAINEGSSAHRGSSELIVASAHQSAPAVALPTVTTPTAVSLAGGTDGDLSGANVATRTTTLLGVDTAGARTGLYALRGAGATVVTISDHDISASWTYMAAFSLEEGCYIVTAGPVSQAVSSAVSTKASAGLDSYGVKLLLGDWCYYQDNVNGKLRLVSPAAFVAGRLSALSPSESALNKPVFGIVGTQKTSIGQTYSHAELQELGAAGIDVLTNPVPGGTYFGCRLGHNASSNPVTNGDNYTRTTNYIASTLDAGLGLFIGKLQSANVRRQAKVTLESFLATMEQQGQIGNADGTTPFSVQLDVSNNPAARVALGYMQADIKVQYLSIIEKFLVNVEGGQSVTIERLTTELAA